MSRRLCAALLVGAAACGGGSDQARAPRADADSGSAGSIGREAGAAQPSDGPTGGVAATVPDGRGPVVMFIGTSLTAGYGLDDPGTQAWPARVGELAAAAGTPIRVVNQGLSGETSAGALERADWILRGPADIVVIETGANDGLRGLDVESVRRNIDALVAKVRAAKPTARIVLVQMEAPPNLGERYTREFRAVYPAIATKYGIPLVPFLLEGVAGHRDLNQTDGIHPTPAGARIAARTVWGTLAPVVRAAQTKE